MSARPVRCPPNVCSRFRERGDNDSVRHHVWNTRVVGGDDDGNTYTARVLVND